MNGSFVVIYYGNTGSTWLVETLSTSPHVLVPAFEPLELWAWTAPDTEKMTWIRTAFTPPAPRTAQAMQAWFDELSVSPQFKGVKGREQFRMVGFKMSEGVLADQAGLLELLDELGTGVITLQRSNRLKHALSLYRYHEEEKSQFERKGIRAPSKLDLEKFDGWVQESTRLHNRLLEFRRMVRDRLGSERSLELSYEEFVTIEGKQATIERIGEFLRFEVGGIMYSRFEKATPDDLATAVVNFRSLRRRYRSTDLARWLDG
jgi:hypothetical protein